MIKSNNSSPSAMGDYFFHIFPPVIIREVILQVMLELEDIARLEVAAAIHRLHKQDKVNDELYNTYQPNVPIHV
jgi:hypothetical protein